MLRRCCLDRKFQVSLGFCALICVLGWYDLRVCLWFLMALLCHEVGHIFAMVCCGVTICGVSLRISGAVIQHGLCTYRQELICAAAGPAASVLLSLAGYRLCPELSVLSAILGLVNLLPLYPLDGGRILRGLLLLVLKEETALHIVKSTTFVVCCVLMAAACCITASLQIGIWPIFAVLAILWRTGCANWSEK